MNNCKCKNGLCTLNIPLFKNLDLDIQEKLVKNAIYLDKKVDDILLYENDKVESVLIIREGRVKLNKYDKEGKEYILDILHDGDTIGENLLVEGVLSNYNVICITNVKICEIKISALLEIFKEKPEVALNLINVLITKLNQANRNLELLHENDAMMRIIKFFIDRYERLQEKELKLTIDDIAASINLRRETVSRKITELQKLGLIKREGHKSIYINDINGLKNYNN
ncbi:MAG: Crp/Fnr family transcriptional regulator [Erysipelotrichaceae bacterium]|nr:Crp/Fnr family transcriptional regulator [Erysipelotrichaceae bacterium]